MMLAFIKIKKNRTVWCFFHDTDGESGLLIIYTVTDLGEGGGGGGGGFICTILTAPSSHILEN